jgi:hypothetical protein
MKNGTIEVLGIKVPIKITGEQIKTYGIDSTYMTIGGVGSVIRQSIKYLKSIGEICYEKLWVRSESYSGGNSVKVYLMSADESTMNIVESLMNGFEYGNFDPMIDLYNYKEHQNHLKFNDGSKIECSTKYGFVNSRPPYGVKEYELHNMS